MNLSKGHKALFILAAAILLLAVTAAVIAIAGNSQPKPLYTGSLPLVSAKLPQKPAESIEDEEDFKEAFGEYWADLEQMQESFPAQAQKLSCFWETTARQFLSGSGGENQVYSPLNLYMSLSMLAEITDGDTRRQILDLLGSSSLEELRTQSKGVWLQGYLRDDLELRMNNSIWLNNSIDFKQATLDTLAQEHFADSFRGEPGTEEFDKLLQDWLNQNTAGLLEEQVAGVSLDPLTIITLASTVYYRADWGDKFDEQKNIQGKFHAPNGDQECTFMRESVSGMYYRGEHFGATSKRLGLYDGMLFILPDEGQDIDGLLAEDSDLWEFLAWYQNHDNNQFWRDGEYVIINTTLPKFDIESQRDLAEGLQNLGLTQVFDPQSADLSPLMENEIPAALTSVKHAARVAVDEEGCTAASFVLGSWAGASGPPPVEVDFTLDRPFLFMIELNVGYDARTPLYIGVVNQP